MNKPRLIILAVATIVVALAFYVVVDRDPAPPSEPTAEASPPTTVGVAPRASDSPFDLRDRDRSNAAAGDSAAPEGTPTPEAEPAPEAPAPEDRRSAEPGEPATVVGPPASPTIEANMAAAKAAADDAIAEVRGDMRRKCWDKVDRGGVGNAQLGFSLSFDPEGHVVASAVQQGREGYIQGLDTCLAPFAHAIEVPALGESVSVEVTFELP
jgi:hypothetical protein